MTNSYDEKELQLMSYPLYKKKKYLFKMNRTKRKKKKVRNMKN